MLFCIDIGNTNIVLGLFSGRELIAHWRLSTARQATADEYGLRIHSLLLHAAVDPAQITGVALCSVVPQLTDPFKQLCQRYIGCFPFLISHEIELGMRLLIDRPHEVGSDRIVNCVAAKALVGGPVCVVDFGTATKFDVVSSDGDFLGGAIAPGLGIAAEALFARASKLYAVPLTRPARVVGRNTVEAMQAGIYLGYVGLVESLIERIRREVGPELRVIATGGLSPLIVADIPAIERVEPWLTLYGLRILWELNQSPLSAPE